MRVLDLARARERGGQKERKQTTKRHSAEKRTNKSGHCAPVGYAVAHVLIGAVRVGVARNMSGSLPEPRLVVGRRAPALLGSLPAPRRRVVVVVRAVGIVLGRRVPVLRVAAAGRRTVFTVAARQWLLPTRVRVAAPSSRLVIAIVAAALLGVPAALPLRMWCG